MKQYDLDNRERFSKVITIDIMEETMEVRLVPNPVSADLDIILSEKFVGKTINIELYDITGKKVIDKTESISSGYATKSISTQNLSKGIYLLKISGKEINFSEKIVKN